MPSVDFPNDRGTARGFLAAPPAGAGLGLVVVHEPGVHVRQVEHACERFAAEGFTALAPEDPSRDLAAAIDFLEGSDRVRGKGVGVVTYDLGPDLAGKVAALPPGDVNVVVAFGGTVPPDTGLPVQAHETGVDVDDEEAARTAWVRTLELLRAKLG
jgi:dienelactone hydrolase